MTRRKDTLNLDAPIRMNARLDGAADYRTDIDGLRAIAVLLVILYHYDVPGFGGGFVGVDVFFVISGFLIASHIARDIRAGRFSLLAFYERRIRRILPALFGMYALVLVAGVIILFPRDLHFLSRIGAYVIPFLANYVLYQNAGVYGGEFADHVILLHTWSLAVEEQFYLLFPLLMLVIAGMFRARYTTVLWPLALISLAVCSLTVRISPVAAFYLAPFRAWELLTGALLALGNFSVPRAAYMRSAVTLLGLLLLAAADLLLKYSSPYPSELALLPCIGAALILYGGCGQSLALGRLLGSEPMRRIGLWSYSLYLYHWPLLLLVQYYAFEPLSILMRSVLLAVTFLLGALSWRYVEQPFRGRNGWFDRRALYTVAGVAGSVLMAVTLFVHRASDPSRYDTQERIRFPAYTADQDRCKLTSPEDPTRPPCILGDTSAPVRAVLWGDSHAAAMLPAFSAAFSDHREAVTYVESDGCPPLLDAYTHARAPGQSAAMRSWMDAAGFGRGAACKRHNDSVLDWIIRKHFTTVILGGHWIANTEERYFTVLTDAENPDNESGRHNAAVFGRGLERLLVMLQRQHVRIFVMDDAPENPTSVPYELASARRLHLREDLGITRMAYDEQQHNPIEIFRRLEQRFDLHILRPQDVLCASGRCAIAQGEVPFYVDNEHLSPAGAIFLRPELAPLFTGSSW
ncbi:MAG TPA: acyltransferase family protein [Steroidobacteraceae bacterium]